MRREELEARVVQGRTLREMAAEFELSVSTVRYWLNKYGLKTRNKRGARGNPDRRRAVQEAQRRGRKSVRWRCDRHGDTDFAVVSARGQTRCRLCLAESVARRRRKVKEILVAEAGGRCWQCGYDKCLAALAFHHLDPAEKSFGIAQRGRTKAMAELRGEVRKCALLCANCHAEIEAGYAVLTVKYGPPVQFGLFELDRAPPIPG